MFQKNIFKTVIFSSFLSIISSHIPICLTWRQHNNYLQFVCHVDDLHLSVTLKDPANDELAFCLIPLSHDDCLSHFSWVNVTQNLTTNETVFSVDKKDSSNINGNWTCQHGYHGDVALIEVDILDPVQKSAVLNVFVWAFSGVGMAYIILEILSLSMKYRGKGSSYSGKCSCMIKRCECCYRRRRYLGIVVFIMATALYAGIITIFTIIPYEDSDLSRRLSLFFGMTYVILVSLSSRWMSLARSRSKDRELPEDEIMAYSDRDNIHLSSGKTWMKE